MNQEQCMKRLYKLLGKRLRYLLAHSGGVIIFTRVRIPEVDMVEIQSLFGQGQRVDFRFVPNGYASTIDLTVEEVKNYA